MASLFLQFFFYCHCLINVCTPCFQTQPFGGAARPPADLLLPGVDVAASEPDGPEQGGHGSCNGSSMSGPFIVKCCRHHEIFNPQSGRAQGSLNGPCHEIFDSGDTADYNILFYSQISI
jgi:hypothetical protein